MKYSKNDANVTHRAESVKIYKFRIDSNFENKIRAEFETLEKIGWVRKFVTF